MVTNDLAPPENAAEVLERVRAAWASLESALAGLSEAQLTQVGPFGWSVKDHLTHIAAWERGLTALLRRRSAAMGFGISPEELARLDIDQLNDVLFQRDKTLPLGAALDGGRQAHAELMEALETLSDEDVSKTLGEYGAETPNPEKSLLQRIAADSYAHYAEHQVWIGELLSALR